MNRTCIACALVASLVAPIEAQSEISIRGINQRILPGELPSAALFRVTNRTSAPQTLSFRRLWWESGETRQRFVRFGVHPDAESPRVTEVVLRPGEQRDLTVRFAFPSPPTRTLRSSWTIELEVAVGGAVTRGSAQLIPFRQLPIRR